jgi:hypothetical protein
VVCGAQPQTDVSERPRRYQARAGSVRGAQRAVAQAVAQALRGPAPAAKERVGNTPSGTITFKIFLAPPADSTAAAIKAVTDKLNGMLELDGGSAGLSQYTPTALAEGGGSPSAIWNYDISAISTSGLAGTKLNAAGSAGDPWGTALPGAYGSGTADGENSSSRAKTLP